MSDVVLDLPGTTATVVSNGNVELNSVLSKEVLELTGGSMRLHADSSLAGPLTLAAGTLEIEGDLSVNGGMSWRRGTVSGSGTLIDNGALTIVSDSNVRQLTANVRNAGSVVLSGTYEGLRIGQGATFTNLAGATVDTQGDIGFKHSGDPAATFVNQGTLIKSAGTTAPYFHRGSAETLAEVLARRPHSGAPPSAAAASDLLAFPRSIDGETPPFE